MPTTPFPEIKTERLLLRKLVEVDWEMISYLRSDKTVNQFVKRPPAETKEKALAFIAKIDADINQQKNYYWCISKINNSKMIGSICLWNFSEDRKTAEVGYDLSQEFQDKGIMNETLIAILKFGFNTLNLEKIEAYTQKNNKASKKLLENNGFTLIMDKVDEDNEDNLVYEINHY